MPKYSLVRDAAHHKRRLLLADLVHHLLEEQHHLLWDGLGIDVDINQLKEATAGRRKSRLRAIEGAVPERPVAVATCGGDPEMLGDRGRCRADPAHH